MESADVGSGGPACGNVDRWHSACYDACAGGDTIDMADLANSILHLCA